MENPLAQSLRWSPWRAAQRVCTQAVPSPRSCDTAVPLRSHHWKAFCALSTDPLRLAWPTLLPWPRAAPAPGCRGNIVPQLDLSPHRPTHSRAQRTLSRKSFLALHLAKSDRFFRTAHQAPDGDSSCVPPYPLGPHDLRQQYHSHGTGKGSSDGQCCVRFVCPPVRGPLRAASCCAPLCTCSRSHQS